TCHRRLAAGKGCPSHGGAAAPAGPDEASIGPGWSERVGARIGSGGCAAVWSIPGGVLKVAHADHELARARMAREAEALAAIGPPAGPRLGGRGGLGERRGGGRA